LNKLSCILLFSIYCFMWTESFASNNGQVEVIQLNNAEDARDASLMSKAIDGMSKKVMECKQRKQAPASECFCLYPKELSNVSKVYEETIKKHPNWKDKGVSYEQDGINTAISLSGVGRQLEIKCKDSK